MILSPLGDETSDNEIEAMKNQFSELHRRTLDRQTSNQFLLRMTSNEPFTPQQTDKNEDQDEKYGEKRNVTYSDAILADNEDEKTTYDEKVNESTVDQKDLEAMRQDFNQQQKKLLRTQIEKSFRIRSISLDIINNNDDDEKKEKDDDDDNNNNKKEDENNGDEFNHSLSDIDDETEEKLMEDSEEMKMQFQQLNQRMIRMQSAKTLEIGIIPQIKAHHKDQFIALLQDIGIVNEYIIEQLWDNIAKTVHQDDEFTEMNGFEIESDEEEMTILSDIEEDENEPTPQKLHANRTAKTSSEWNANIDEATQSFAKILEDLNDAISRCRGNFSVSNVEKIGAQNADELVAGNSVFRSKLTNCHKIMQDIQTSSGAFVGSMQEMEKYIAGKYIPSVKNYAQWSLDDICVWIKSLDNGRFVPYINVLLSGFKESQITNGLLLRDLNTADLGAAPFNIKNFKDKRDLVRIFKSLNTDEK